MISKIFTQNSNLFGLFLLLIAILILGFYFTNTTFNMQEGMTSAATMFYGPNGGTAVIKQDSNGINTLAVTNSDGTTTVFSNNSQDNVSNNSQDNASNNSQDNASNNNTYYGPNNTSAIITTSDDGSSSLTVTNANGSTTVYSSNSTSSDSTTNTSSTTNYDNYNHYNGSSNPTTYYGPDGGTAQVITTDSKNTLVITNKNGTTDIYYIDNNTDPTVTSYSGENGGTAKMITDSNGNQAVEITSSNGSKVLFTADNTYTYNSQDDSINQYSADSNTTGSDYTTAHQEGPNGGSATSISGPNGNTYSSYDSSAYYNSSTQQGIPRSQIPAGDEDLYILKTEVIPPVCPKCPEPIVQCPDSDSVDNSKCPPCPACARCPEPAFDCKKVPNYAAASNQNFMPVPVLNDFSTFGM